MSRIGKQPISVPKGVKVNVSGQALTVEGPKGKLSRTVRPEIGIEVAEGELSFTCNVDSKTARAYHGLERALANNMVVGVSEGYEKELALVGVGYRAEAKGTGLTLALGYSHPIDFPLPDGVKAELIKEGRDTFVKLISIDKQLLGQTAARIRALRSPEPYKGKGVRYRNEEVRIKAGKAGKAGGKK
jgi:large subunit ribosomal protein L6